MLNAEDFIKQHSRLQKQNAGAKQAIAERYDLKLYRSKVEIANDLGISRQTVANRIGVLGFHELDVHGVKYYVKDRDIIKFAFYLLQK